MLARDYSAQTLQLVSQLLLLNPEYYTVWNDRRRVLLHGLLPAKSGLKEHGDAPPEPGDGKSDSENRVLALLQADLDFLIPLLRKFPKCYWIWNHRLWLLREAQDRVSKELARGLWQGELRLVSKMLVLDGRNFHGWGYRRVVVEQLESADLDTRESGAGGMSMAEDELLYTTKMIEANLSNFSAWHYRSNLAPRVLVERKADGSARRAFLRAELETILAALYTDPYDQSLWAYHHWLMSHCLPGKRPEAGEAGLLVSDLDDGERRSLLSAEMDSIRELLEVEEDCKCTYEALVRYSIGSQGQPGAPGSAEDVGEVRRWLGHLRRLDPLRTGRWDDVEAALG